MNFLRKTISWKVRIPPSEVWKRIEGASDSKSRLFFAPSKYAGDQPLLYTIVGKTIVIQKRLSRRNDFQTELRLQILPNDSGSNLQGKFGVPFFSVIFFGLFLIVSGIFGVIGIYNFTGSQPGDRTAGILFVAVPGLMFLYALFSIIRGLILKSRNERTISYWLEKLFADVIVKK